MVLERSLLRLLLLFFVLDGARCFVRIAGPTVVQQRRTTVVSSSAPSIDDKNNDDDDLSDVGFVLLAGGKGSRMKANVPKQFLELQGVPILHHSLHLFLERLPRAVHPHRPPAHVVLVMDPSYQAEYQPIVDRYEGRISFAQPGVERQGSVENGLRQLLAAAPDCQYAAIHDSARPLVTIAEILHVVRDAKRFGAAVLGVPCKATIKESADGEMVLRTIPRARLWEVHTPQVIQVDLLQRGFAKVRAESLEVTDDVSIVEQLNEPVKLTLGEYTNLKITTPEDMDVATAILVERKSPAIALLR
jgi:2-C-methyl-D-erythritol 4-phosphate cytidylyltransferase